MVTMVVLLCSVLEQGSLTGVIAATNKKQQSQEVEYITVNDFIEKLIRATKVKLATVEQPYLVAAYETGILKDGEVTSFNANITREQAALLLNRADEYMHGDTLKEAYVSKILERRISDIKKVGKKYREAVAKVYGKGIVKGFSNGYGVQSRQFRGKDLLTLKEAKIYIKKMKYPKYRAKLSPDAQLIRTTKLPKNADKFEYILECFPNEFYEKPFRMESLKMSANCKEGDFYDYPINMRNTLFKNTWNSYPMSEQMDLYLYDWADSMEKYVNHIFNVNYKTIDKAWSEKYKELDACHFRIDEYLEEYIENMKKYKTKVETRKIAVEPSTFYKCGSLYMRVYIEYKISANKLVEDKGTYIYCIGAYIPELKLGEWNTSYFDIEFSSSDPSNGDGSTLTGSVSFLY